VSIQGIYPILVIVLVHSQRSINETYISPLDTQAAQWQITHISENLNTPAAACISNRPGASANGIIVPDPEAVRPSEGWAPLFAMTSVDTDDRKEYFSGAY
jgi:hypothetical protein